MRSIKGFVKIAGPVSSRRRGGDSTRSAPRRIDAGHVTRAEAVVDVDDGDPRGAGVQHRQEGGQALERGAVADARGDGDHRAPRPGRPPPTAARPPCPRPRPPRRRRGRRRPCPGGGGGRPPRRRRCGPPSPRRTRRSRPPPRPPARPRSPRRRPRRGRAAAPARRDRQRDAARGLVEAARPRSRSATRRWTSAVVRVTSTFWPRSGDALHDGQRPARRSCPRRRPPRGSRGAGPGGGRGVAKPRSS